jgi:hypothetical protein
MTPVLPLSHAWRHRLSLGQKLLVSASAIGGATHAYLVLEAISESPDTGGIENGQRKMQKRIIHFTHAKDTQAGKGAGFRFSGS